MGFHYEMLEAVLYYLIYAFPVCILYQFLKLMWTYWIRRPVRLPDPWFIGVRYLLQGPEIMIEAYKKAAGKLFAMPTLTTYQICVSDRKQITELISAKTHQLSLRKSLNEIIYPKHTRIASLELSDREYSASSSALMRGLRPKFPALRERLQEKLAAAFEHEIRGPKDCNGWISLPASAACQRIAGSLNSTVILGEKLSSDPALVRATLHFARDAAITALLMPLTPSILQSSVSFVSMHWSGACRFLQERISDEILERLSSHSSVQNADKECLDCIQWTIDASRRSKHLRVTGTRDRAMGFLFASHHQVPPLVVSSLYRLCKHPEYFSMLQEEVLRKAADETSGTSQEDSPLLDSFIKETARLHPLQIASMNRKVVSSFDFSDGTHVPEGNTICVPQQAIMQDPELYSNPLEFQGFRFVTQSDGVVTANSRLSDSSPQFQFWGPVGHACPARFYVSKVIKMILVHVIKHYDIKLANENAEPHFSLGMSLVAHPRLTFLVRKRNVKSA